MGGSSGGSQQDVVQTQTNSPWSGAQPHLTDIMSRAGGLYSADTGYQPFTGQMQSPVSGEFQTGYNATRDLAGGSALTGTVGLEAGRDLGLNMIQNRGLSPQLQSLLEQQQGQENPYLKSIIDTSNRRIGDRINSSMSGAGRYGSGAHTDVAARAMAEAADPLLAQDYARRQQMQQDILTGGLDRAGQWSQLMPTLDRARYDQADRMMGLGQWQMDRGKENIANQIQLWNAQQARPWEQLARYNAIASGVGGLGGTQVKTSPNTAPPLSSRILGGAVAGAGMGSMFGGLPGAGVGALGGGLLGML